MNADSYFETDPWSYAVDLVQKGDLGRIATFAVQAGCKTGQLEQALQQYQIRVEKLFGKPVSCDKLETEQAVSLLVRYEDSIIGRVFIDQNDDEPFCNFEFVGTDALLIWKPDVCSLSMMKVKGKQQTMYEHPYAVDLSKKEGCHD